ncbi:dihydrofolate reductase [Candidatus Saccharibacteria bacterium]|nr:dihydrofolate reductase [Candidatus Saccharibacteria bacterium]
MSFSLIACIGKNRELGKDNDLVFHFKEDMKFFREKTKGKTVVMGYNTWKSLKETPLKGRTNLILSHRDLNSLPESAKRLENLDSFIKKNSTSAEEIFVIGGASVYKLFLPHAKTLYLTEVEEEAKADVFFPTFKKEDYDLTTLKSLTENTVKLNFNKYIKRS